MKFGFIIASLTCVVVPFLPAIVIYFSFYLSKRFSMGDIEFGWEYYSLLLLLVVVVVFILLVFQCILMEHSLS